jgi:Ca-activated chloride channel family protein
MDVIKSALKEFVSLRSGDRIGLVVFSEQAYVISPLTTDYDYLDHYIDLLDAQTLAGEGYTAIGEGIAAALSLLDFQGVNDGRQGIVIVCTDGENNFGRDPIGMMAALEEAGHRGYLVGLDLPEYIVQRVEVQELVRTFEATGGQYYDAGSADQLSLAYQDMSALESTRLKLGTRSEEQPVYHLFLAAALACLLSAVVLRTLPWFVSLT